MKYKLAEAEGWVYQINEDGTKSPSFTNRGEIGRKMWIEYQEWLRKGNTPEPAETKDEQESRLEAERAEAMVNLRLRRNQLLLESDVWMLPDYPNGGTDKIKTYRQALRDLPATCKDPANPVWPEKPM